MNNFDWVTFLVTDNLSAYEVYISYSIYTANP